MRVGLLGGRNLNRGGQEIQPSVREIRFEQRFEGKDVCPVEESIPDRKRA